MDAKDIRNLSEAYMEVYASQEELDEAEGSYGQTPKAHAAFASLAAKRQQKPASQYPQRGVKTKAVASAEKHTERSKPTPAHRGRGKMDDESREYSREKSEVYGGGRVSDKGGTVTKNPKKLRKQKAMGEIGEQVDIYDIILSHLLDEGYAETVEDAEIMMVNMSEEWRDSIVEATAMAKRGHDEASIRQRIAQSTGGGEAADRAKALADRQTYGDEKTAKARQRLARIQVGDFRKTTSSSPGLHGYAHKSDDPEVKAKQAARGAQRGALTPREKKQLGR